MFKRLCGCKSSYKLKQKLEKMDSNRKPLKTSSSNGSDMVDSICNFVDNNTKCKTKSVHLSEQMRAMDELDPMLSMIDRMLHDSDRIGCGEKDNFSGHCDDFVQSSFPKTECGANQPPQNVSTSADSSAKREARLDESRVEPLAIGMANLNLFSSPKPRSETEPDQQITKGHTMADSSQPVVKTNGKVFSGCDIYPMNSSPRGLCVIVNNVNFEVECFSVRNGSDVEANYLQQVYTQLGFKVEQFKNLYTSEMLQVFKKISKLPELIEHDAFVCIILTHGDVRVLVGTDGLFIGVETIVGCFNNYNCPALMNKPKLFFIQACRGNCRDFGVVDTLTVADAVPRQMSRLPNTYNFKIVPTWTDTLIVYSTMEGYVSLRNEKSGSWFGDALGSILCENACDYELHELLLNVNRKILEREKADIHQAIECIYRGFNKKLYFNPGHFIKKQELKKEEF